MRRKVIVLGCLLALLALLTACEPPKVIDTLDDIVYQDKSQKPEEYKIYIQEHEDGPYEPYLVLEEDYDGGVLLLRFYLLDKTIEYRTIRNDSDDTPGSGFSYYPDSDIDDYIRDNFLPSLTPELRERILETSVLVADVENYTKNGEGGRMRKPTVEAIQREVFLLSATEMNVNVGYGAGLEGEYLFYFNEAKNYAATFRNGASNAYWLRSAHLGQHDFAWFVGRHPRTGVWSIGGGWPYGYPHALRPAFCLAPDTAITRAEVDGAERYVLAG